LRVSLADLVAQPANRKRGPLAVLAEIGHMRWPRTGGHPGIFRECPQEVTMSKDSQHHRRDAAGAGLWQVIRELRRPAVVRGCDAERPDPAPLPHPPAGPRATGYLKPSSGGARAASPPSGKRSRLVRLLCLDRVPTAPSRHSREAPNLSPGDPLLDNPDLHGRSSGSLREYGGAPIKVLCPQGESAATR